LKINIGCGMTKDKSYVNVDKDKSVDPDVVADLESGLPFENDSARHIFAAHIMEHIRNFPQLMNECHRVLRPDGMLYVVVPVVPSIAAFSDPTHVRYFTEYTFDYFYEGFSPDYGFRKWTEMDKKVSSDMGVSIMEVVLSPEGK